MKHTAGTPSLTNFGFWDYQSMLEKEVAIFIKTVLDQIPPEIELPYGLTTGNPVYDGGRSVGFRPNDPLTIRLYLKSFCPDDGTSIEYEDSVGAMIDRIIKWNPDKKTLEVLKESLSKEVEKIQLAIDNWVEHEEDDEDYE